MADPTPGDVVDDDTLQAVQAIWKGATGTLPQLVTQGPKWGRLKSPETLPYAQVNSELARRELSGTAGGWMDHRKVTLKVWGQKADVVTVQGILVALFHRRTRLVYPSGARFIRWWPDSGATLTQDPATKDGRDVWISTMVADVWSVRLQ